VFQLSFRVRPFSSVASCFQHRNDTEVTRTIKRCCSCFFPSSSVFVRGRLFSATE
jgi:hypothetical protein